jgi:hypothetical protein
MDVAQALLFSFPAFAAFAVCIKNFCNSFVGSNWLP